MVLVGSSHLVLWRIENGASVGSCNVPWGAGVSGFPVGARFPRFGPPDGDVLAVIAQDSDHSDCATWEQPHPIDIMWVSPNEILSIHDDQELSRQVGGCNSICINNTVTGCTVKQSSSFSQSTYRAIFNTGPLHVIAVRQHERPTVKITVYISVAPLLSNEGKCIRHTIKDTVTGCQLVAVTHSHTTVSAPTSPVSPSNNPCILM
ncbi:hypothetical protein Pelo_19166 [Pelomyxa schiedti]|nr:hypothetical protein Pelo_19166 [Pelomyxa schiedti]